MPSGGLAEVLATFGPAYLAACPLPRGAAKIWRAIVACRTAVLGGHVESCSGCGMNRHVYHSCRNRHCPTCHGQTSAPIAVTVTNTGNAATGPLAVALAAGRFSMQSDTCTGQSVPSLGTCTNTLVYAPTGTAPLGSGGDFSTLTVSQQCLVTIAPDEASAEPMIDTAKKIFGGHMGDPTGPLAIAGSPQRVREQIQKHIDLGCTMFLMEFFGRDTREPAKLFAETVLPHFK